MLTGHSDSIPGLILRLRQRESVGIVVDIGFEQNTTVLWHSIRLPIGMDGVPGISRPPIEPGEDIHLRFHAVSTD